MFFVFCEKFHIFCPDKIYLDYLGMNGQYSWQILALVFYSTNFKRSDAISRQKNIVILQCRTALIFETPVPTRPVNSKLKASTAQAPDFWDQPENQRDIFY